MSEDSILKKGQQHYLAGEFEQALVVIEKVLQKDNTDKNLLRLQSACYYQLHQPDKALQASMPLATSAPIEAADLFNLSHLYFLVKKYSEAESLALQGLNLRKEALGYDNLSAAYIKQGKEIDAEKILLKLITDFPAQAKAHHYFELANLIFKKDAYGQAVYYYLHGLKLKPESTYGLINLTIMAVYSGDFALISQAIEKIKLMDSSKLNRESLINMCVTFFSFGYFDEAIDFYKKALILEEDERTRSNYAMALLAKGDYEQGWLNYLSRVQLPEIGYKKHQLTKRLWQGEKLNRKTLLLVHEQGFGDTIQFVRFTGLLKQKYKVKIILKVQVALARLFEQLLGVDQIITAKDELPAYDYHLPILSLPYYLKIFSPSKFMPEPYLVADKNLIEQSAPLIKTNKLKKIGIFWRGSDKHKLSKIRNCQLNDFLFLTKYSNISVISLQKEFDEAEKQLLEKNNIINAGDKVKDMADTAAIISQLDLLITIDSAVAHVAGAMGKTVWLLLPYQTEWRHPRGAALSPWYQSVYFYRQPNINNWGFVFAILEKNIQAYLQLNT